MNGTTPDAEAEQRERVMSSFLAYASAHSELGRRFARRMEMHPTDAAAIVNILRAEERGHPLTPARLVEQLGLSSGATSILLNRLEDAGHVVRQRGHADRRLVTLQSTPTVHEAADAFFGPLRSRFEALMSQYTPDQLKLIEHFVTELQKTVEGHADETSLL